MHELAFRWLRLLERLNETARQPASPDRNAA
jgi:hypothetical protein